MQVLYRDFYKLAEALESEDVSRVKYRERPVDASTTAFLFYPPPKHVRNMWDGYGRCRKYFWFHKRGQRNVLERYFNVPTRADNGEPPYIVRPVRHFGGRGFIVAEDEEARREAEREFDRSYAVEVVRRTREFRAFFVGAEHTTTMLKSLEGYGYAQAENMPPLDDDELQMRPWNRNQMETRYLTVTREVNDKLLNTSFYEDAQCFLGDHPFDLLAFDVAYNDSDDTYTLFETNFAPECTIETSLTPLRSSLMKRVTKRSSSETP